MPPRGRLYQTECIILGRRDYGEADRVLITLTPEGRLDLLAKGVRKPTSRKSGHLELFTRARLLVARVENYWDIVSQAEAIVLRAGLREDFERATYARYLSELIVRFFEHESNPQLYQVFDRALDDLEVVEKPELLVRWYEQRLLNLAGFRPEWDHCVGERDGEICMTLLKPRPSDRRPYGLDPGRGGALCAECMMNHREAVGVRSLSPSALSWLQVLQRRDYADVLSYGLNDATRTELSQVMEHYISYHLERRPSSLQLLDTKSGSRRNLRHLH
jgi:DNA repair protein RecO (recombination protein O)